MRTPYALRFIGIFLFVCLCSTAWSQQVTGLTLASNTVVGGANTVATVTLSSAPTSNLLVALTSNNTDATLPPEVTVSANTTTATFLVSTNIVSKNETAVISANGNASATLTLTTGDTQSLPVGTNAYILGGANANTNFSPFSTLLVKRDNATNSNNDAYTYFLLNLTNVTSAPASATLKVVVSSVSSMPANGLLIQCYRPTFIVNNITKDYNNGAHWTESNITWNNAPGLATGTGNQPIANPFGIYLTQQTAYSVGQVVSFDITALVAANLGQTIAIQLGTNAVASTGISFYSRTSSISPPVLVLTYADVSTSPPPPPGWATSVTPTDSVEAGDFGASAADSVDLSSGVEENHPGPDIIVYNPNGPDVVYERMYRSTLALQGYGSPNLAAGWVDNYDLKMTVVPTPPVGNPSPGGASRNAIAGNAWSPVVLTYPNGATESFTPSTQNIAGSVALIPGTTVPYVASGSPTSTKDAWNSFSILEADQSVLTFTSRSQYVYELSAITDILGRSIVIHRDPSSHKITAICDNKNNTLLYFMLEFDGFSVTDQSVSGSLRSVYYVIDSIKNTLSSVSWIELNGTNPYNSRLHYAYASTVSPNLLTSTYAYNPDTDAGSPAFANDLISYSPGGRVKSIMDSNLNTHSYLYFGNGQTQVNITDTNQNLVQQWTQNYSGNKDTGTMDVRANTTKISYSTSTGTANSYLPAQASNPLNQSVSLAYTFGYDKLTNITEPTSNGGTLTTQIGYDTSNFANGQINSIAVGSKTPTKITYYGAGTGWKGLAYQISSPKPGAPGSTVTTTYTYTSLGNIATASVPGPNNHNVTYAFNYINDSVSGDTITNGTEALGQPLSVTSPLGNVTHYRYDWFGNVIRAYDGNGYETQYAYNAANQCTQITYPLSLPSLSSTNKPSYTQYQYLYPGGPLQTVTFYDETGTLSRNVIYGEGSEDDLTKASGSVPKTTMAYDALYRTNQIADGNKNATKYGYDVLGNLTQTQFPNANSYTNAPNFDSVLVGYDSNYDVSNILIGRGPYQQDVGITFGRAMSSNKDNSVLSLTYSDGSPNVTYTYDNYGRVTEANNGTTVLDYNYDDLDNVTQITTKFLVNGSPSAPQAVTYTYNDDGSRATMTTPAGQYTYSYDDDGRLTAVSFPWQQTITYNYDAGGRLIKQAGSSIQTQYVYDHRGFLLGLSNTRSDGTLLSLFGSLTSADAIKADPNWIITSATGNILSVPLVSIPPMYADAAHLYFSPDASGDISYTYDDLSQRDRLTNEFRYFKNPSNFEQLYYTNINNAFAYDADDNLTTLRNYPYQFNADNQFLSSPNPLYNYYEGNGTLSGTTTFLNYNFSGWNLGYESGDRLNSVTDSNYHAFAMGYRADGLRAWKNTKAGTKSGAFTYYLYDGTNVVCELVQDANGNLVPSFSYGYGASGLVQTGFPNDTYIHYAFDPQGNRVSRHVYAEGSTTPKDEDVSVYDAFGELLYNYDSEGYLIQTSPYALTPLDSVGFGGQWGYYTDIETQLVLCGYRFYNPSIARFLTRDPIGYDGGINLYAYSGNNPVNRADPTGTDGTVLLHTAENAAATVSHVVTQNATAIAETVDAASLTAVFAQAAGAVSLVPQARLATMAASIGWSIGSPIGQKLASDLFGPEVDTPEAEEADQAESHVYLTYVLVNQGKVVYVGRASGLGSYRQALMKRLSNHKHWHPETGDKAYIIDRQFSYAANRGAEQVWYDYYRSKGAALRNIDSPIDWKRKRAVGAQRVKAFFDEMTTHRFP